MAELWGEQCVSAARSSKRRIALLGVIGGVGIDDGQILTAPSQNVENDGKTAGCLIAKMDFSYASEPASHQLTRVSRTT